MHKSQVYCSISFAKCVHPGNSNFYLDMEYYPHTRKFLLMPLPSRYSLHHCSNIYHHGLVLSVLELHINGVIQYLLFCIRIFSLKIICLRFTSIVLCIRSLLLLIIEYYPIVGIF